MNYTWYTFYVQFMSICNHGFSLLPKSPLDVVLLICSLFGPRQLAIRLATKANNLILRWIGALRGDGSTEKNVAYIHI